MISTRHVLVCALAVAALWQAADARAAIRVHKVTAEGSGTFKDDHG